MRRLAALLLVSPLSLAACGARQNAPDELAVTRVVLYQSGIAYIEREGTVSGDELVLPIRPDQVNDILNTLVVVDREGTGGTSVSLPIDSSASDRMADLPPELRNAGGMVAVLAAFRGADVVVRVAGARTYGRIVGVETIDGEPHATLLTNGDALVPIAISQIDAVDLRSESLSLGLNRSLDHSLASGEWKPTDVAIRFGRDGNHDITLAYVVEMPIWKPAYRVIVDGDDLLLQGWAVVDNTSGVDWNDVQLSLTAGTPLSFRYDLHTPIYVDRPDMTGYGVVSTEMLRPPEPIAASLSRNPAMPAAAPAPVTDMAGGYRREMAESMADGRGQGASYVGFDDYESSVGESAAITEVASLFRFDIPGRVTLPDQSSTMVTLINSRVGGQDALVYQPDVGTTAALTYPYRALLINNTTAFPIQPAPVAIYSDGTFVGQGITPTIAPAQSAVISYALESRVSVTQNVTSNSGASRLVSILDGIIRVESEYLNGIEFTVRSSLDDESRLFLKVSRYGGYELVANSDVNLDDVQTEAGYYLIPANIPGQGTHTIRVEQVTRQQTQLDIFDPSSRDAIALFLTNPGANAAVADRIRPIQAMVDELNATEQERAEKIRLRGEVQVRTNELRQNIIALGDSAANAELRATLADRLAAQDAMLEEINRDIVTLAERSSVLRIQATEAIREIRVEGL